MPTVSQPARPSPAVQRAIFISEYISSIYHIQHISTHIMLLCNVGLSLFTVVSKVVQSWDWTTTCYSGSLSGVPDLWDRNKILRCGDLSHLHVPDCIWVFFYFVWLVFIHHNFQFSFELCTYCNILVNCPLFYMKLLNYLFCNMFGSVLQGLCGRKLGFIKEFTLIVF